MHDTDRRRLVLAALITLVAVPAFFIISRQGDDDSTEAASDATETVEGANVINPVDAGTADGSNVINPLPEQTSASVTTEPPAGSRPQLPPIEAPDDDPIFMNGPVAIEEDEVAEVAVPAQPAVPPLMIDATYLSTISGTRSCLVQGVETGRTVQVTNLANGRSISCVTVLAPRSQRADLIMHVDAFAELADLTDAPIAVEVRL